MESNKTIDEYITSELEKITIGTRNYALASEREISLYNFGAGGNSDGYDLIDSFKNCFGIDYYAISADFKYQPQASLYGTEFTINDASTDPIYQIAIIGSSEVIGEPSIDNPAEIKVVDSVDITINDYAVTLPLYGYELCQNDVVILDVAGASLYKNSDKIVFDGSEDWLVDNENDVYISFKISNSKISSDDPTSRICDKLPSEYYENASQLTNECNWFYMEDFEGGYIGIVIRKNRLISADVDGFKIWLVDNNITLYYPAYHEPRNVLLSWQMLMAILLR